MPPRGRTRPAPAGRNGLPGHAESSHETHPHTPHRAVLAAAAAQAAEPKLWYAKPAERWEQEALPIGNGRLGAMIFGGVGGEPSSSTRTASGSATKPTPARIRHSAMSSSSSARAAAASCPSNVPAVRHRPAASRSRPALTVCPTRNGAWNIITGRPSGPAIAPAAQSCPPTPSRPATTCRTATRSRGRWKARTTARTGRSLNCTNEPPFPNRHQCKEYTFANAKKFQHYRFTFFEHGSRTHFQVAEIELGQPNNKTPPPPTAALTSTAAFTPSRTPAAA